MRFGVKRLKNPHFVPDQPRQGHTLMDDDDDPVEDERHQDPRHDWSYRPKARQQKLHSGIYYVNDPHAEFREKPERDPAVEAYRSVTHCRAGHFRYFFIFSIIKNDFFAFLVKVI